MIRYLSIEEVLIVNGEVLHGRSQLRDRGLLESALARPMAASFGEDSYPSTLEKASTLLHSICKSQAFVHGNKRTALVALILFLELNGFQVLWNPKDALEIILAVAQGEYDVPDTAAWLARNTDAGSP